MKKGSMAIVLAAVLVATIVGVVWARPNQALEGVTRKVTIPAAAFAPDDELYAYHNDGEYLYIDSGLPSFLAPVVFPCVESVKVTKVSIVAKDYNADVNACAYLYRSKPESFTKVLVATACTDGSGGEGIWDAPTISNARIYRSHGPYIRLNPNGTNIEVWAVIIEYQRYI